MNAASTETVLVTVDREAVLDAVAALDAAVCHLAPLEPKHVLWGEMRLFSEHLSAAAEGLWISAFGRRPEDDAVADRDPLAVETEARSLELMGFRRTAQAVRERGTIDVDLGEEATVLPGTVDPDPR
jgi:hypothetical protein